MTDCFEEDINNLYDKLLKSLAIYGFNIKEYKFYFYESILKKRNNIEVRDDLIHLNQCLDKYYGSSIFKPKKDFMKSVQVDVENIKFYRNLYEDYLKTLLSDMNFYKLVEISSKLGIKPQDLLPYFFNNIYYLIKLEILKFDNSKLLEVVNRSSIFQFIFNEMAYSEVLEILKRENLAINPMTTLFNKKVSECSGNYLSIDMIKHITLNSMYSEAYNILKFRVYNYLENMDDYNSELKDNLKLVNKKQIKFVKFKQDLRKFREKLIRRVMPLMFSSLIMFGSVGLIELTKKNNEHDYDNSLIVVNLYESIEYLVKMGIICILCLFVLNFSYSKKDVKEIKKYLKLVIEARDNMSEVKYDLKEIERSILGIITKNEELKSEFDSFLNEYSCLFKGDEELLKYYDEVVSENEEVKKKLNKIL